MWKPYAVYKCGSSLFLENCKDNDFLYIYERERDYYKAIKMYPHSTKHDSHVSIKTIEETKLAYNSYAKPYMELIDGNAVKFASIFDHKKEYAQLLLDYAKGLNKESKRWYHVYLGANALENGKGKKFTKTQLKVAQKIHDNGVDDAQYSKLFDYLQSIVNN